MGCPPLLPPLGNWSFRAGTLRDFLTGPLLHRRGTTVFSHVSLSAEALSGYSNGRDGGTEGGRGATWIEYAEMNLSPSACYIIEPEALKMINLITL